MKQNTFIGNMKIRATTELLTDYAQPNQESVIQMSIIRVQGHLDDRVHQLTDRRRKGHSHFYKTKQTEFNSIIF